MVLKFTVSSPGKVILHGEHSVVYGKPAVAGVVGIRNYLTLETYDDDHKIVLNFDMFKDTRPPQITIESFNQFYKHIKALYAEKSLPNAFDHIDYLNQINEFICKLNIDDNDGMHKPLQAVIYLLIGILCSENHTELNVGLTLHLDSGISMGAGLGSSASFGVCLASAFYFYAKMSNDSKFINTFNNSLSNVERYTIENEISEWAFCSEKIMHGNPSGLDNAICTFGSVVQFYKGAKPQRIECHDELNVLLVNTRVSRSTATLVQNVAKLRQDYPMIIEMILNAMGAVTEDVLKIYETGINVNGNFAKLNQLISINNNLLRSLDVSHPTLEIIFRLSTKYGFSSKLTGAGGGGYAFVLLPSNYKLLKEYHDLCAELIDNNFEITTTTIGGGGLDVVEQ